MSRIPKNPNKDKKNKNYFNPETEQAIVDYFKSEDQNFRNRIFEEKIYYALYKLSENLIHTYKFYYMDVDSVEDLKHELIALFIEKFPYLNPEEGKAYSYLTRTGYNYLVAYNIKNYKKVKEKRELDDVDNERNIMKEIYRDDLKWNLATFFDKYINFMDENIPLLFSNPLDIKIAYAVLELFKKRENIEVFNKKALYIFIREQVPEIAEKTTVLTNVVKKMDKKFNAMFKFYEKTGKILG